MLQLMQSDNPVSCETGILNRKWKALRFIFAKRSFESQVEAILTAAAGHESNSLPVGDYQYQVLCAEADSVWKDFSEATRIQPQRMAFTSGSFRSLYSNYG